MVSDYRLGDSGFDPQVTLASVQDPILRISDADLEAEGKAQTLWRPSCIKATRLLTLCLAEGGSAELRAWSEHAFGVAAAVSAVNSNSEAQQPGTSFLTIRRRLCLPPATILML